MPAEHLPAPAAIQADDMIVVNGSPDRNCGCSRTLGFRRRFAELSECLMDRGDQNGELIRLDLIAPNIGGDDRRHEFGRLLIGHRLVPLFLTSNNIPTPVNSRRQMRTPHIARRPDHPFVGPPVLRQRPTGLSCMNSTWEVARKVYGGNFLMLPPGTAYGLPVAGFRVVHALRLLRAPPHWTRAASPRNWMPP